MILILFIILFTFIYGSMAGYFVHWILHTKLFGRFAESHNIHHTLYTPDDFESETYRDAEENDSAFVFIPIITGAIAIACVPLWFVFQTWWIYLIILAVGVSVGWLNDHMHEAFHLIDHRYNKYAWFKRLKDLHMQHHIHPKKNHGIIWFGPDKLFKTFVD